VGVYGGVKVRGKGQLCIVPVGCLVGPSSSQVRWCWEGGRCRCFGWASAECEWGEVWWGSLQN